MEEVICRDGFLALATIHRVLRDRPSKEWSAVVINWCLLP